MIALMYIAGTFAILGPRLPARDIDPQSGVFHAMTAGSIALGAGFLGIVAALLVTVGNAGGVGSTVAGIARVPFVVGIDRYLPAAFGKIHPRWKTPWVSILVQATLSWNHPPPSARSSPPTAIEAYQLVVDAAHHPLLHSVPLHVRSGRQARLPQRPQDQ